jgi:MFS family permease
MTAAPTRAAIWLRSLGGLAAFRHRNYRLFFAGQGISLIGTWMTQVAQAWLVLQLTGNPFDLGLIGVFQFTPVLVLGLFGGLIADALPKRPTMYATQLVAMIVSFTLFALAATNTVQLWHVFALALVMGVRNSIDMPTRQAFAVDMVGREDVGNAVALNSAMFNGARIVGPAIAGLTIGAFGVALAFLVDAVTFLAVLLALFLMEETTLRTTPPIARMTTARSVVDNLVEGLAYVRRTGIVLLAVVLIGVVATFGVNFSIVIPPLAQGLGVGAAGYGFLMAASGIGSLLAALLIAFGGTRPSRMLSGAVALGIAEIVIGVNSSYLLDLGLMFVAGFGAISMMATANTTIQLAVPDELRGRVMAVYTTVFAGSAPIGGLLMGGLASNAGAPAAILFGGAISVLAALGGVVWFRRLGRAGRLSVRRRVPAATRTTAANADESATASIGTGLAQTPGSARR